MAAMCSSGRKKGDDPSVCGAVSSIPDVCEASHRAGSKEKKKKIHENFEKSGKPKKCKKKKIKTLQVDRRVDRLSR